MKGGREQALESSKTMSTQQSRATGSTVLAALALAACSSMGTGWRAQTVIHAWEQTPPPGFVPVASSSHLPTLVELDDGHVYEVDDISGLSTLYFLKPGAQVEFYSAKSKNGQTYYSMRITNVPGRGTVQWQVRPYKSANAQGAILSHPKSSTAPLSVATKTSTPITCVDTSVRDVQPRLVEYGQKKFSSQDFQASGVVVDFDTYLGSTPAQPKVLAAVTHYQGEDNAVMLRERPGDVRVCFLSRPQRGEGCNPDKDTRGRMFSVYDYRQRAQYSGMNSEHGCGGA